MNKLLTFAFIGGDRRQLRVIVRLALDGHQIRLFGLEESDLAEQDHLYTADSVDAAVSGADVVVLPLPYTAGEGTVNAPFSKEKIYISDVLRNMNDKQILFAGKVDEQLHALAVLHHVHTVDYMGREELAILNAIPTAEGALEIAMQETPFTIHGSRCLVIGNGRIGKILAKDLKALGADTYVASRKYSDLAWSDAYGYHPLPMKELTERLGTFDLIFNTAPTLILDFKRLSKINDRCLIIDLASRPGGVDFETAQKLGKKVIWALSLPGKVAPDSAGDIIKNTIINILEELGV